MEEKIIPNRVSHTSSSYVEYKSGDR
jgi:hypothetical protein